MGRPCCTFACSANCRCVESRHFAGRDISGAGLDRIARASVAGVRAAVLSQPDGARTSRRSRLRVAYGIGEPWTPDRVFELFPRLRERAHNMGNQLSGGEPTDAGHRPRAGHQPRAC